MQGSARLCAERLGDAAGAGLQVVEGASSLLRGLVRGPAALLGAAAGQGAAGGPWRYLLYTPAAVTLVSLHAAAIRALLFPLRWMGLVDVGWDSALRASSVLALMLLRLLLPEIAQETFFVALSACDKGACAHVREMPVISSLRQRALSLLTWGAGAAVLCGLLVVAVSAAASTAVPAVAAAAAGAVALLGHFLLPLLAAGLLVAGLAGGGAYVYSLLEPLVIVWRFDPLVALAAAAILAGTSLRLVDFGWALSTGTAYYYSSVMLTQEFLAPYSQRLDQSEWRGFCRRHAWRVAGFGLPVTLLAERQPLAAVALLQAIHAASAVLLADILRADSHAA